MRSFACLSSLLALTVLAGCGGSSNTASGSLDLAVADTPVDGATHVTLVFTGVELQTDSMSDDMDMMMMDDMGMADVSQSGNTVRINFAKARSVDLLQQQDGKSAQVLSGMKVPAGSYTSVSFDVDTSRSTITLSDGSVHPLTLGAAGISSNSNFAVAGDGSSHITVDFDLRQAVGLDAGVYSLQPALRVVDDMQAGSISGSAPNTAMVSGKSITAPSCMPAAYVYAGANVTPVDLSLGASVQPVATATLKLNNTSGQYTYTAAFLPAGAYTVAFICAAMDDPTRTDSIALTTPQRTMVTARTTSMVNLP